MVVWRLYDCTNGLARLPFPYANVKDTVRDPEPTHQHLEYSGPNAKTNTQITLELFGRLHYTTCYLESACHKQLVPHTGPRSLLLHLYLHLSSSMASSTTAKSGRYGTATPPSSGHDTRSSEALLRSPARTNHGHTRTWHPHTAGWPAGPEKIGPKKNKNRNSNTRITLHFILSIELQFCAMSMRIRTGYLFHTMR